MAFSKVNLIIKINNFVKYFKRGLEIFRGGDLGGTGTIVPLKNLGGGTEVLLSPHYLENVLQIYTVKG